MFRLVWSRYSIKFYIIKSSKNFSSSNIGKKRCALSDFFFCISIRRIVYWLRFNCSDVVNMLWIEIGSRSYTVFHSSKLELTYLDSNCIYEFFVYFIAIIKQKVNAVQWNIAYLSSNSKSCALSVDLWLRNQTNRICFKSFHFLNYND